MKRPIAVAVLIASVLVALPLAAWEVTYVLKNGQRLTGQLVYRHDANLSLNMGGQERTFAFDDVAIIAFVPGNPPAKEIAALSDSPNPPEHDRHMLAFRDGRTLRGKFYDFVGDTVIFDTRDGSGGIARQTFPLSSVARLYVDAPSSRDLFPAAAPVPPPGGVTPPPAGGTVIQVDATKAWTDTGIDVKKGDRLSFSTRDQIRVDRSTVAGPDGANVAGNQDVPIKTLGVGALIGRVGVFGTFPIGSNTSPIVMPAAGRLRLGINDNRLNDNSGAFNVTIRR